MKLIETNLAALEEARAAVAAMDDRAWSQPAPHCNGLCIGAQMRHIIEFYLCFFEGVPRGCIDYDARRRDVLIQKSRRRALSALGEIGAKLPGYPADGPVRIHANGTTSQSTIARELQVLLEHTIHHFALIAIAMQAFGIQPDPAFGVAPSTLRYRADKAEAA